MYYKIKNPWVFALAVAVWVVLLASSIWVGLARDGIAFVSGIAAAWVANCVSYKGRRLFS